MCGILYYANAVHLSIKLAEFFFVAVSLTKFFTHKNLKIILFFGNLLNRTVQLISLRASAGSVTAASTPWSIKTCHFYFLNSSVKHGPILIIFGTQHQEKTRRK